MTDPQADPEYAVVTIGTRSKTRHIPGLVGDGPQYVTKKMYAHDMWGQVPERPACGSLTRAQAAGSELRTIIVTGSLQVARDWLTDAPCKQCLSAADRDLMKAEQVAEQQANAAAEGAKTDRVRRFNVIIPVSVDEADYRANYGHIHDLETYTSETIRALAAEQFKTLGWGRVIPDTE